ncbi:MAG: hypothetical protein AB7Q17_16085 [Phycisphaerae bacterium]
MSKQKRRLLTFAAILGGTLLQVPFTPSGCYQYGTGVLASAFDFCSVVNCTGGAFFNFCDPVVVFVDCP